MVVDNQVADAVELASGSDVGGVGSATENAAEGGERSDVRMEEDASGSLNAPKS